VTNAFEQRNREMKALRYADAIETLPVLAGLSHQQRAELVLAAMKRWGSSDWEWLRRQIPRERDVPSVLTRIEIEKIFLARAGVVARPRPVLLPAIGSKQ